MVTLLVLEKTVRHVPKSQGKVTSINIGQRHLAVVNAGGETFSLGIM